MTSLCSTGLEYSEKNGRTLTFKKQMNKNTDNDYDIPLQ